MDHLDDQGGLLNMDVDAAAVAAHVIAVDIGSGGRLFLSIGGHAMAMVIAAGEGVETIGNRLISAIHGAPLTSCTATVSGGVVTLVSDRPPGPPEGWQFSHKPNSDSMDAMFEELAADRTRRQRHRSHLRQTKAEWRRSMKGGK